LSVFVDTSAFYAALDRKDQNHDAAREIWTQLGRAGTRFVSTNYVVVETFALVQSRLGLAAVRALQENLLPLVKIHWIDQETHAAGVAAVLAANRRALSLVDCVSFIIMRQFGIHEAFAFDGHFTEQGFTVVS
jgi:predicted nucleic acid-binding protein